MAISIESLRTASTRSGRMVIAKSLNEARQRKEQTAFLCHSHDDSELAKGLQVLLYENGWELYIDWQDLEMPDKPNRETAQRIQAKIKELDWFIFLATPNSTSSKWCPWEIGYADSAKHHEEILIIPTVDRSGKWYGNEYLQLYRQINTTKTGSLAVFKEGTSSGGVFVRDL